MSGINSDQQIDLLFKQFNVVANTEQAPTSFANQPFLFRDNILNQQILAQEVPSTLPSGFSINELDICGNIAIDSSLNLSVIGYPQLTFYKKLELQQAGNNSAWWHIDGAGKNLLQDTIPFKFDESSADSYNSQLFYELSPGSYAAIGRDEAGTKYLMDTKTGIIEFYEDPATLNTIINASSPPRLSFIAYTGTKGITGGGGGDISFNDLSVNNLDVSNNLIVNNTQFLQTIGPELLTINTIKYFRIAQINMSDQLPANSGPTVCSGRFMIKTEEPPSTCIEFIAGFYSDKFTLNDPPSSLPNYPSNIKPFIKVIHSNGEAIMTNGINFICIGIDGTSAGDPDQSNIELIIGFKQGFLTVSNATVRLYDNNEGTGNNDSDYRDWTLDESFTLTTGPLNSGYNIVKQVNIDTFNSNPTGNSVAVSSLDSETFMGNVNVGEKITVLGGIDISGDINIIDPTGILNINGGATIDLAGDLKIQENLVVAKDTIIDGSLNVSGNTYLNDPVQINDKVTVKSGAHIDASNSIVKVAYLDGPLIAVDKIYSNGSSSSLGTGVIGLYSSNLKFMSNGVVTDLSYIVAKDSMLNISGGLTFVSDLSSVNIIRGLSTIQPILGPGGDLIIQANTSFDDNNLSNINTIIPGINQSNLLTISGGLFVDGSMSMSSIYPSLGNNIGIFGNLLMNDFKISNVGELIMNGNIDLSLNNIENVSIIKTKNIYGDSSLNIQTAQGDIDINAFLGDVKIQANTGNLNLSQRLVTHNPVELDMSGNGVLDITTKNGQNPTETGGLEITTINNKDKAPHTFYNALPTTIIAELSNNDMPNGSIALMNRIGGDVQGISGGSTPSQSQTISLPIIKLLNEFETTNYYKYMYLGNENTYTFFNRRPGRDESFTTRGSDTVGSLSPYKKDISSGFVPHNATRYVQGSGGISYFYFDVSNNSSSNNFVSTCKFEVLNPISHMNPLGPGWTTTDYSGTGLSEYALLPGNTYPINGIVAIPSRNNIGPYLNREGYITEISYYFPFWQQSEIIGIAGPIIFRNLAGSSSGPDAPYISIYIDGNETKGTTIGGNPLGEIELKKYPATLGTTLIKGTGDTITLPPEKWIYVGKNANLSELIKMKIVIPPLSSGYDGMSIGVCGGMIRTSCMLASTDAGQLNFQDSYDIGAIQGHLNIITLPSYVSP